MNTQSSQPVQSSGGMMGGLGGMIVQGMAFGTGSAIGHQVVRSVMGGSSDHQENKQVQNENQKQPQEVQQQQTQKQPCYDFNMKFVDCLKNYDNDISMCQQFFDDLKTCQNKMI
jgi:hypothetical protein